MWILATLRPRTSLRVCKYCVLCSSQDVSYLQDSVFQDLGEGILENALQVVIIVQWCLSVCEQLFKLIL